MNNGSTTTSSRPAFVTKLNDDDCLMGRGSRSSDYSGNVRFRQLVIDRREEYIACTIRSGKQRIAQEIIQTVRRRGGRFLQRIVTAQEAALLDIPPRTEAWHVLEPSSFLYSKVKQLMRDVGPETQAKRKTRREAKRMELKRGRARSDGESSTPETAGEGVEPLPKKKKTSPKQSKSELFVDSRPKKRGRTIQEEEKQPPEPRVKQQPTSSGSTGGVSLAVSTLFVQEQEQQPTVTVLPPHLASLLMYNLAQQQHDSTTRAMNSRYHIGWMMHNPPQMAATPLQVLLPPYANLSTVAMPPSSITMTRQQWESIARDLMTPNNQHRFHHGPPSY